MAVEAHPAHSQQWPIVDFESDGDSGVTCFLTRDSNARVRMAQLIQAGANRQGNSLQYHLIRRFPHGQGKLFFS